ncbi:isoprenylcysteine carboxylmethyltransferase family protein [Nocardioides sp. 616]|uniref:methyltransferase family protein n=1 Tax=Nocardioides sp. 616 TaxID=2268090 RepID=UPI0013B35FC8|nr:isoprenylcysteine carboxylmethyltransferase family protein [Nocardioides sp. 616]
MEERRLPPPVLVVAGLLGQQVLPGRGAPHSSTTAAAVAIGALSVALAATTAARFAKQHTTVHPLHPDRTTSLVTSGPNQFSRNPMYVGMTGLLVANAVRLRSLPALLVAVGFVQVMERTQIAAEEQALSAKFGAEYADYRARVPRWLGPRGTLRRLRRGRGGTAS